MWVVDSFGPKSHVGPRFLLRNGHWGVIDLSVVIFLTFFWGGISSAASGYRYCSSL